MSEVNVVLTLSIQKIIEKEIRSVLLFLFIAFDNSNQKPTEFLRPHFLKVFCEAFNALG